MASTIQLSEKTKKDLKEIKSDVSYEQVIKELIRKNKRQQVADDMKEYGQKYGKEGLDEVKEWEKIDEPWE